MSDVKVRSQLAMKLANIDRGRFNEAVSTGLYPCAPETIAGSYRTFTLDDLVTLTIFGRLLQQFVQPKFAGHFACAFGKCAAENPGATTVSRVTALRGNSIYVADYDPAKKYRGGDPVSHVLTFNVADIRARLLADIAEERAILGADDTE